MWTGAISFGLVSVPVKLYSALDRKTVRFHQLSGKSGVRISQKRVDPQSGEEVPYEDIVKGFEITPERYVVIEPAELDALAPQKSRTIEIEEFVELGEIDPVYYDHPYYLAPGPGGAKPYRLLHEAMRQAGKVAIARVVIRSKESLVAIRPIGEALGMATMIFADEITPPDRFEEVAETTEVKTTKRELEIAIQLVDSLAAKFEPQKYHDTYRKEVLDLIERKAQGEEIAVQPAPEEVAAPAPDLMSALKASLDQVRARDGAGAGHGAADGGSRKPARKAAPKKAAAKPRAKKAAPSRR
jgi:DNA end-binding protein Ku